ncbi:MAG: hypothetical protein GTN40_00475, partial [Candidatus Aenigmarchaeota archaeon]|nr:hypothetical protein [Candidatus Aenigmarchaeota archaeon]
GRLGGMLTRGFSCTFSGPLEKIGKIDGYVSKTLEEYSKKHEDELEVSRRISSNVEVEEGM